MQPRRGQSDDRTLLGCDPIQLFVAIHTPTRSRQRIAALIQPWHLRRFASDQRATRFEKKHAFVNPLMSCSNTGSGVPRTLSRRKRAAPTRQCRLRKIPQVLSDGVVPVHCARDLQLGANPSTVETSTGSLAVKFAERARRTPDLSNTRPIRPFTRHDRLSRGCPDHIPPCRGRFSAVCRAAEGESALIHAAPV